MTPEITEFSETDNPFFFIEEETGVFLEPIKNPFSCEGSYLFARKYVKCALQADEEVGNDVTEYKKMLAWLDKLAYEYI